MRQSAIISTLDPRYLIHNHKRVRRFLFLPMRPICVRLLFGGSLGLIFLFSLLAVVGENSWEQALQGFHPSQGPQDSTVTKAKEAPLGVRFINIAKQAGIDFFCIFGGLETKKYIIETTGSGVAFLDFDRDGWQDLYFVTGTLLEGHGEDRMPTNRLYRNNGDGTFKDVTEQAGLIRGGWGQGVCVGDYDNDGWEDLFVTYWGQNALYRNQRDGTFEDLTRPAGLVDNRPLPRWGTGCAFIDYDKDGHQDLFVSDYVDLDLEKTPAAGEGRFCQWKGIPVMCGPRGLPGGTNRLFHNNGDGTFTDVSQASGVVEPSGYYSFAVLTTDFDNDGWTDIYVACDSTPSILYHNNGDGTFTDIAVPYGVAYNEDGLEQAGMGVSSADYNRDGWLDIFKTNFSDDTSTLYRNNGDGTFTDATFEAGMGVNTRYLGWGCSFIDFDNDGWKDIVLVNGHVYPELQQMSVNTPYLQPKILYKNLRNGRFQDVSVSAGPGIVAPSPARGMALGDFDNDGDLDIAINNMNGQAELLRNDGGNKNHSLMIKTIGTKSNRSGLGARIRVVAGGEEQIDEVRSGASYISQNDLRVHFGLGQATRADLVEIKWPSGAVDTLQNVEADQVIYVEEGKGVVKKQKFLRPGS